MLLSYHLKILHQEAFEKGDEGVLFDHLTSTGSGYDLRQRPEGQVKVDYEININTIKKKQDKVIAKHFHSNMCAFYHQKHVFFGTNTTIQ